MNILQRSINRVLAPYVLCLLCFALGACSTIGGAPPRLTSIDVLSVEDPAYKKALDDFYTQPTEDGQKKVRNQFVETRIAVIDHEYLKFRQSLYQGRVGAEVGTDLALLTFNGLGAVVSSTAAKTTYAAMSAALVGGKTSIDKNVYFERTVSALLSQMDTLRNNKKVSLFQGLTQPLANYPLSYAKAETDEYYLAGTIARAIQGVNLDSAAASLKSETTLRAEIKNKLEAKGVTVTLDRPSPAGDLLDQCYGLEANQQPMKRYLAAIGYTQSLSEFTSDAATVAARDEMLAKLRAQGLCR